MAPNGAEILPPNGLKWRRYVRTTAEMRRMVLCVGFLWGKL